MKNMVLNPGGIIGGVLGVGTILAIQLASGEQLQPRAFRYVVPAVIVGAIVGNVLWRLVAGDPRARMRADGENGSTGDEVERPTGGIPVLRPLPTGNSYELSDDRVPRDELDDVRGAYREPPPRAGFGIWMAIAWCLLYAVFMQVIAAIALAIPIFVIAAIIKGMQGGPANIPTDSKGIMADPVFGPAMLVLLLCTHIAGWGFGWLILRWQVGRHWKRKIALTRGPTLTHWVLILIGFPAMLTLSAAIEAPIMRHVPSVEDFLRWIGVPMEWPGIEALMPLLRDSPWGLALVAIAVLPAINEEFWTRGFIAQGLSARYRTWVVVLVTSFLFGCLHLDPRQGLGAMLLGAVIHATYLATRSLWAAMAIHFANNAMAVIHVNAGLFPILQPLEDGLGRSAILYMASAALLFAAIAVALYQTRCKLMPEMEGMPSWEPPGVSSVELPPPGSGTVVTHDPLSPLSAALVAVGAVAFGLVLAFA